MPWRDSLVRAMTALVVPEHRPRGIPEVSSLLGIETFMLFLPDPQIATFLAAPGFPQTLPGHGEWAAFVAACSAHERKLGTLPWPDARHLMPALGVRAEGDCIAVLVGGTPPDERVAEFARLLPLMARGLASEQARSFSEAQSAIAQRLAQESAALAMSLDVARRAAQQEVAARACAEAEARAAREELARINTELEARVEERTANLKQTIADLDAFSYSISHDIRAPLRAMRVHARAVLEDAGHKLAEVEKESLHRILRAADRLDRLTSDVLRYSRLARVDIALRPVDLARLLREVLEEYASLHPSVADIAVCEPLLPVLGDDVLVVQCLANVLTNAVKFVAPNVRPSVRVWTEPDGALVRLCVEDNGIGVSPAHEHRLFGLFDRIHPDHLYEGTGVGLAIVKRAAGRMGGDVGMQAASSGGSIFWITLPRASVAAPMQAQSLATMR